MADWSFEFADGETSPPAAPPASIVDSLEFAKATLQHELSGVHRTALHLQSQLRSGHAAGLTVDELAVHAGLARETVEAVIAGTPLVDLLFVR
jgi:hypothetical protein